MQNGVEMSDVEVMYELNGTLETAITDTFGRYIVPAPIGSKFEIMSVDGRGVNGTMAVTLKKKLTEVNIHV
jgi:hypothetical protein